MVQLERISNMKILGLTGVAKAGKDTFYKGLIQAYPDIRFTRLSVADIIRRQLDTFIFKETGINVLNCTPEEKEIVRPLLAWYGDVKRKQTQGRFFIDQIEAMLNLDNIKNADYLVITDIRFKEFTFDEPDWIHSKMGKVIHLTRILKDNTAAQPANELERINDPKMNDIADIRLGWPTLLPADNFDELVARQVKTLVPLWMIATQTNRN